MHRSLGSSWWELWSSINIVQLFMNIIKLISIIIRQDHYGHDLLRHGDLYMWTIITLPIGWSWTRRRPDFPVNDPLFNFTPLSSANRYCPVYIYYAYPRDMPPSLTPHVFTGFFEGAVKIEKINFQNSWFALINKAFYVEQGWTWGNGTGMLSFVFLENHVHRLAKNWNLCI